MGLISCDDVIKILNNEIYTEECEFDDGDCVVCWVVDDKYAVIEKIKMLPVIKSRPKGKWIVNKNDSNYNCSVCGCNPRKSFRASSLEWIREINGCDMQYCPWCGAYMGGSE